MSVPIVKVFDIGEKVTAEDLNAALQILAAKFGSLDGTDFQWPLVLSGDVDLAGNRLLRLRELFGILNLEEYGGDETAFEQAVNELSGGGMIYIPRNNVVELTRSIKIRSNRQRVSITGSGHSSQLKLADNADSSVISLDGARRFTISNLFINGNKDNNQAGHGLRISGCEDFVIENLWIGGTVASPNDAGTPQASIYIENCRNFQIRRVWIRDAVGPGIRVVGSEDFDISTNTIRDCVEGPPHGVQATGVLVLGSRNGRVYSNDVRGCAWDGIHVDDCSDVRVHSNQVRDCTKTGIWCGGGDEDDLQGGHVINGNMISGCEFGLGLAIAGGMCTANHARNNETPISLSGKGRWGCQNNQVMDVKPHGVVTMPANVWHTNLDVGVAKLPIQSIQATWNYQGDTTLLQDSVLGTVYGVNGENTITFYTAKPLAFAADIFYSVGV